MNAFLGIDVSKGYADFSLLDENKQQLEDTFQLDDTFGGHASLKGELQRIIKHYKIDVLYCGVESTGGFENNWYEGICKIKDSLPVKVSRINPIGIKHSVIAGLNRNITDSLSSVYIAEYMIGYANKVSYEDISSYYNSFRSEHKHILMLKKQQNQLINHLKIILYSSFPEMTRFCKQSVPNWVLKLLIKYPSSQAMAKAKVNNLVKMKNITTSKATQLIENAKNSVASRSNSPTDFLVKSLSAEIIHKQELIKKHKDFLIKKCKGKEIDLLCSITGIAEYTSSVAMIEIEDINRFPSTKHIVSYFGIHPKLKESGDKKYAYRMSKKGRGTMRAALYMAAKSAVIHSAYFKKIYHKHRSKGMSHNQAIGVIMQKLIRIIWGVLKSGKPFCEKIAEKNQEKLSKESSEKINLDKKRRLQEIDENAPISNIQRKKRKALLKSQDQEILNHTRDQNKSASNCKNITNFANECKNLTV